jgi:hypothetical protein
MSAPKNGAKCLKGQKSQRNGAKNGVMFEDFTQKPLHQTIRLYTAAAGALFRPSLTVTTPSTLWVSLISHRFSAACVIRFVPNISDHFRVSSDIFSSIRFSKNGNGAGHAPPGTMLRIRC